MWTGIIGTFPALNQRTSEGFEAWLQEIEDDRAEAAESGGHELPPYGVNLIVHRSNPRVQPEYDCCSPALYTHFGFSRVPGRAHRVGVLGCVVQFGSDCEAQGASCHYLPGRRL